MSGDSHESANVRGECKDASVRGEPWEAEGSFIIERYVYEGVKGGTGIQWLAWRIQDGQPVLLRSFDTRRDAVRCVNEW